MKTKTYQAVNHYYQKIVHHWGKQKGLCWGSTSRSWKEVQNMLDSRIPYLKMLRAQFLWSRISIALCLLSSSSISPFKTIWYCLAFSVFMPFNVAKFEYSDIRIINCSFNLGYSRCFPPSYQRLQWSNRVFQWMF